MKSLVLNGSVVCASARGTFASVVVLAGLVACGSSSPPHAGADGGSDASAGVDGSQDAADASAEDSGFPQCAANQRCVGNPSLGDWVCLDRCDADGGGCPTGMTCQMRFACCGPGGCTAASVFVCLPSDTDASSDAESDAATDAPASDGDGGIPQCASNQACVGYPAFGDWVCLEPCGGADGGECPTNMTCVSAGGCCSGTGCSAVSRKVCVTQ